MSVASCRAATGGLLVEGCLGPELTLRGCGKARSLGAAAGQRLEPGAEPMCAASLGQERMGGPSLAAEERSRLLIPQGRRSGLSERAELLLPPPNPWIKAPNIGPITPPGRCGCFGRGRCCQAVGSAGGAGGSTRPLCTSARGVGPPFRTALRQAAGAPPAPRLPPATWRGHSAGDLVQRAGGSWGRTEAPAPCRPPTPMHCKPAGQAWGPPAPPLWARLCSSVPKPS